MKQNRRIFLGNAAFIGGAITLRTLASKAAQASLGTKSLLADAEHESTVGSSVRQLFHSTPKKYRPLVRWWWPGDDVTEAELRRQVRVLDQAGFGGAEIQAYFCFTRCSQRNG
jgi:hypothetical protein